MDLNELMGNVKQNVATADPKEINIVILGEAKTGKTTLYRDLIKIMYGDSTGGLLLKFEDGVRTLSDIQVYPKEGIICDERDEDGDIVESAFEKVEELTASLVTNKDKVPFSTICVDVIDSMYEIFEQETIRRAVISEKERALTAGEPAKKITSLNKAFGGYGNGGQFCNKLMRDTFYLPLKTAGYRFVDISHVRLAKIKNKIEENEYQVVTSTLPSKSFGVIKNDAEVVLFIVKKKSGEGMDILFRDDSFYQGGSRLRHLPERIDCDAQLLYDTIKQALIKEANIKEGTAVLTEDMEAIITRVKSLATDADKKAKLVSKFKEAGIKAPTKKNLLEMEDEDIAKAKEILKIK